MEEEEREERWTCDPHLIVQGGFEFEGTCSCTKQSELDHDAREFLPFIDEKV